MKMVSAAALLGAFLLVAYPPVAHAQSARFRHLTSVYADANDVGFVRPEAVACDGKGRLVVGDTGNGRLVRFTYQDRTLSGGSEIRIPELSAPSHVELNSKGEIYVLDGKERRILRLGPEGEFKGALAFQGVPPPSTIVPKSFKMDASDHVYVLDVFSARVLVLGADGQFQRAIPFPSGIGFASDVAFDVAGNVLLLDGVGRRIYSAAKDGAAFAPLGGDLSVALSTLPTSMVASKGTIFVVEGSGNSIVSIGRDGAFLARQLTAGRGEGSLEHPSQICINDRDEAFIADRDNSRVQVFSLIR